jgi:Tc5 transposase DNA-binding domain/DDE superfamily endonuclease/CENP-B N-terminal DNA-binding domain
MADDADAADAVKITSKTKRHSYTLKQKLNIVNEYAPGVKGKGYWALSRKYNITTSTIRGWCQQKDKMIDCLTDPNVSTKVARRLKGGGRKHEFMELELVLIAWIKERNQKGLRVKEKYIQIKALQIAEEMGLSDPDNEKLPFKASNGWIANFKKRNHFVSRRQTTSRVLPKDADMLVRAFHESVQDLIEEKNIKDKNILNMDQVPRYFESEAKSTITTKGSKNVLMRKAASSHKRFTATFTIGKDGKMLKPHLLFSKLKKLPKVNNKTMVAVNPTGMWSKQILDSYMQEVILKRPATSLLREPVLLIIDSYGPHIELAESRKYEKYNVFIRLVPPNMTGVLQPLDVAVNKSFQESFASSYDEYITEAIENDSMQTKIGNPKVPNYETVSNWVLNWSDKFKPESIQKSFFVCGIGPKEEFSIQNLHEPLRTILEEMVDTTDFEEKFGKLPREADDYFSTNMDALWFWPKKSATSFFECVLEEKSIGGEFKDFFANYCNDVVEMIKEKNLTDIFDEEDEKAVLRGESTGSEIEIYIVAQLEHWKITVTELDEECLYMSENTFTHENPNKTVDLIKFNDFYALKL